MIELIFWTSVFAAVPFALVLLDIGVDRIGNAIESRICRSDEPVPPTATAVSEARERQTFGCSLTERGSDRIVDHTSATIGSVSSLDQSRHVNA
jgi:hypothetical protein